VSELRSCLYRGRIMHHRRLPFEHRFVYRVFSLLLDLDELPILGRHLRLLSVDRPNLLSFHQRDHGPRDGSPLLPWALARLAEKGVVPERPRIRLLCFPRILGYVFDPLSIYFGYDGERLVGVVYEVKNTFGEQTTYVLPAAPRHDLRIPVAHGCPKSFYVSPFIPMQAHYAFRFREPGERLAFAIRETVAEGTQLVASHTGERRPLEDRELLRCLLRDPLMTLKVIGGIHWEAARLWLKGARYFPREVEPQRPRAAP
jgi:DUF1365 family protein